MTRTQFRAALVGFGARILFIAICFGVVGGGIEGLMSQTFNVPERVRALEVENEADHMVLEMINNRVDSLASEVSQLHGIGIGVGGALGILQIVSLVAARKARP